MPSRLFEEGTLLMSELTSVAQHISIYRRARSKTFAGGGYCKPGIGTGDGLERQVADRKRHPDIFKLFERDDFGNADARGNLALKRQGEPLSRAKAGQSVQYGQYKGPPCRECLIRRPRQRNDGNFCDSADRRGSAGLQRDAVGEN